MEYKGYEIVPNFTNSGYRIRRGSITICVQHPTIAAAKTAIDRMPVVASAGGAAPRDTSINPNFTQR